MVKCKYLCHMTVRVAVYVFGSMKISVLLLSISSYVSSHFQQSMADLPPGKPQISEKGGVSSLGNSPGTDSPIKEPKPWMNLHLPAQLQWIPRNWTWSNLKPVIRCSIVAWVSAVLFIIPRVELLMGQVCFLVLMCTLS